MKKQSWLVFVIPTILGLLFGFFMSDFTASLMQTIIDIFIEAITFLAPFLVIIFFGFGIAMIKNRGTYLLKYFAKLLLILSVCSLFAYFVAVIFVTPFVNSVVDIVDNFQKIETLFEVPNLWNFSMFLSIIIGLIIGFFVKPKATGFKNLKMLTHIIQKYLINFLKYFIPIILFASFSLLAYSNKFQEFFIVDLYLSFLIVGSQIFWLALLGYLTTIKNHVSRSALFLAMRRNFILGMSYLPGEMLMFAYVDNIKSANIKEEVAFSTYILSSQLSKPGSIIATIIFAYGVLCMFGMDVTFLAFLPFLIVVVFATMVASSVTGGVFAVTSTYLVSILGFTDPMTNLMQVMYWKQGTVNSGANVASHAYMASAMEDN